MHRDELRGARLLFDRELRAQTAIPLDLEEAAWRPGVMRRRTVTPLPRRVLEMLALRAGWLDHWRAVRPLLEIRRTVLAHHGAEARGSPRLLVRVDEFPHARALDPDARYGFAAFERFDSVMAEAGVPYLIAVSPWVVRSYLDPGATGARPLEDEEWDALRRMRERGVTIGLHHRDHRTRDARPRHWSALAGLEGPELEELLESAEQALTDHGLPRASVFVPPFNRFDAAQYPLLAERFDVVCGGPETVAILGFHPSPSWQGGAVYLPSYSPLYGPAALVYDAVERLEREEIPLWAPVTLHWTWEQEDQGEALKRLAERVAPLARPWEEFLDVVAWSREG